MGPLCPDEYGVFQERQTRARCIFFQSQRIWRKVLNKLKINSPTAMAKLPIDRASIVFGNESGDFYSKSGDREIFII